MLKSNITVRIVRLTVILLGLFVLELIERPSYVFNCHFQKTLKSRFH